MTDGPIDRFNGDYAFLSNFYPAVVEWAGVQFPTVEHAFQAAKTTNPADHLRIRDIPRPGWAKSYGRRVKLRPDWEEMKVSVMRNLIAQKFSWRGALAEKLLDTGERTLIEGNNWGDRFWGMTLHDRTGLNWLGTILMERRAEIRRIAEETI